MSNNIFNNLIVSCPNDNGGLFLIKDNNSIRVDHRPTSGIHVSNGMLYQGLQPNKLLISNLINSDINKIENNIIDDIHDIKVFDDDIVIIGTMKNTIIVYDRVSLKEKYRKTIPGEDDSSHINCVTKWNGKLIYSVFGSFLKTREYKDKSDSYGMVIDLETQEPIIKSLSQPHSLVPMGDNLLLANSKSKELRLYNSEGVCIRSTLLPGYTRGITYNDKYIYVGTSVSRNSSDSEGMRYATIYAIDILTWDLVSSCQICSKEIYEICSFSDEGISSKLKDHALELYQELVLCSAEKVYNLNCQVNSLNKKQNELQNTYKNLEYELNFLKRNAFFRFLLKLRNIKIKL